MGSQMKIFRVVIFSILIWNVPGRADDSSLRTYFFELAPHAYLTHGRPSGVAVDYYKLVMADMKKKYQVEQQPLTRIIQISDSGLVMYLGKNPERERKFHYNSAPLFLMQGVFAVRADSNWQENLKNFDDIGGRVIGVWADGYRSPNIKGDKIKIFPFYGNDVILRGLEVVKAKRIDAFYCPDIEAVRYVLLKNPSLKKQFRLVILPEPPTGLYPAFTKDVDGDTRKKFAQAFERVQKKQSYTAFLENYLKKINKKRGHEFDRGL